MSVAESESYALGRGDSEAAIMSKKPIKLELVGD